MRTKFLVWLLMSLMVFPVLSFAQMKPQIPAQVKPPTLGKAYWCAEVEDILFSKEPQQGQKLTVGVRVKLTKKTIIPGASGQILCDCAFEGPSGAPAKFWSKTMSLRLIGIKYSETETNLLEYYGPTSAFPPYDYSGFSVIGFVVTENDLKKGYIDVWGWASKEPLHCRDATIYASFSVYNQSPYNQKNECHPHPDFKKSFKPKCLQVPKIPEGAVKEGVKKAETPIKPESSAEAKTLPKVVYSSKKILRIPPDKFSIEIKSPIKFIPFDRSYFKIPATQNTVELKNGRTLTIEEFLGEVNELEKKLNKLGYTLRDKEPIKIKYIYPREQFKLQREMLSKDFLKKVTIPLPPQVICEGYSEGHDSSTGGPKDFVPLDWEKNWDASFGNDDFGVNLAASMKIKGEENSLDVEPLFYTEISFLGHKENVLKIYKSGNTLIGESQGKVFFKQPLHGVIAQYSKHVLDWDGEIEISIFDLFKITGTLGFSGYAEIQTSGEFESSSVKENLLLEIFAGADGNVEASIKIASVGVDARLVVINYEPNLDASVILKSSPPRYFKLSVNGKTNEGRLLKGKLAIYGEFDVWAYSKNFEVEFFDFDGYPLNSPNFSYNALVPAERDHHICLKIDKISGITSYTARNEKLDIEPISYDLIVDIDGRTYTKTLKDYNKDGIYGNALGEYEDQVFEIPLLSFKKVPISIEVIEKYKIGTFEFKNTLDFAPGVWKKVELCYDPGKRTFSGTKSGKEDEEITSLGDTSYWGERYHGIRFELGPLHFKAAPAKAK